MELEKILENQYISTSLVVFFVLYGGLVAPKLPKHMIKLFSKPLFRLMIIFLIAYSSSKNHSIALIATIVFILLMQESNDNILTNESVVKSELKSKVLVSKFKMDEEEEKTEGEIIHILKDKSNITETQLVSSVINDEISKLQTENNLVIEKPLDEVKELVEETNSVPIDKIEETNSVPMAMDKIEETHGIELEDNPLSKNLKNGFETVSVKSTRGLKCNKECDSCDLKKQYEIDTNDIILGYDGNGFYNFMNL